MAGCLPAATLRLLGSPESLETVMGSLMHPTHGLFDPSGTRLSPAFTWNRSDVLASMGGMQVTGDELMAEARSESQIDAARHFQAAREAFGEGRFHQSLDALKQALDVGPSLMVAGRLVWRIHMLRALVLLGSDRNADPELIDPAEAELSFLLAARHARSEYRLDAARALLGAGWAAYVKESPRNIPVDRRMSSALTYTGEALDLDDQLVEAQFQTAKFRMAKDEPDQALHGLRWLPGSARMFLLKAAADGDFQRHASKLDDFLEALRGDQQAKIDSEVAPIASRLRPWMGCCRELAESAAVQRLMDLVEGSKNRGILEVNQYYGSGYRQDHDLLLGSFFEVSRTVPRERSGETGNPPGEAGTNPARGSARVLQSLDEETEYQFLNGLGEVLITYRGAPGTRKEFQLPPGDGPQSLAVRWIPPGRFVMGSPFNEPGRELDEVPHSVTLSTGFFFSETLCTQGQWSLLMPHNPSKFRDADRPVEQVNWDEAREFARKLTEFHHRSGLISAGWRWDLPTEAQWEYACRVRKPGQFHGPVNSVAWYEQNSEKQTHRVAALQPNAWGLHDMHGNVGKWCLDWYGQYPFESVKNPAGPAFGTFRVYRGGAWSDPARCCRSAYRARSVPDFRSSNIGFSLVLSGPISEA